MNDSVPCLDGLFNELAEKYALIKAAIEKVQVSKSMLEDAEVKTWLDAATPINKPFSQRVRYCILKMERGESIKDGLFVHTIVRCITVPHPPHDSTLSLPP